MIRPSAPPVEDRFEDVLDQARLFLLGLANAELPAALQAKGGASDLVQETYAAALHSRHQFRGTTVAELRAWLRAIFYNELATFRRRYTRAAARNVSRESPASGAAGLPDTATAQIEELIHEERGRSLAAGVARLSDVERSAVVLRYEHDLPFAEIGRRLGRSEEAARKLCERALARLRGTVPDPAD